VLNGYNRQSCRLKEEINALNWERLFEDDSAGRILVYVNVIV
jgi:hypothetical protein